jgi:replicative DNA helicase
VLKRIVKEIQARGVAGAPTMRGISYGFPSIDAITGGMHSGEMIYVIALTGVGKTALAINTIIHTLASGIGVLAFTTETTRQEYLEAMISCHGAIDNAVFSGATHDGHPRTPSIAEWNRMTAAMNDIAGWKHLTLDATTSPDVGYIESTALARAESALSVDKKPLGLVVVDNLHCLAAPRGLERAEKTTVLKHSSERLKQLARRLGVPVLVLAQRRDAPFDKATKCRPRPQKGELSWCRGAEQDADKVFYLHNPPLERNGKPFGEDKTRVVAIPTKVRRAAERDIEFRFVGQHGRLIDLAAESRVATSRHWTDTDPDDPLTGGL